MHPNYFIFESGKAILGPHKRAIDAILEAKDYGADNFALRRFETDSRESAEKLNANFEKELEN